MNLKFSAYCVLLSLFLAPGVVSADSLPSPCGAGQTGQGTNCMYLVASGDVYDPVSGDRSVTDTGLIVAMEVWINFAELNITGGGFDITWDVSQTDSSSWAWTPEFEFFATLNGGPGVTGWEGIQFDDFGGGGFGGPDPIHIGTLMVTISNPGTVFFAIEQPYFTNTFPNCFSSPGLPTCAPTNFFALTVTTGGEQDTDMDGVADSADNCIDVSNADQRDTNADGFGSVCDGDLNNDCIINFADLSIMAENFFSGDPDSDLDGSGTVNFADMQILTDQFFLPPGPSGLAICGD